MLNLAGSKVGGLLGGGNASLPFGGGSNVRRGRTLGMFGGAPRLSSGLVEGDGMGTPIPPDLAALPASALPVPSDSSPLGRLAMPQLQTMALPDLRTGAKLGDAIGTPKNNRLPGEPTGLRRAAGIFGDMLAGMVGAEPRYLNSITRGREQAQAAQAEAARLAEQRAYDASEWTRRADYARNAPQYFDANGDRVRFDPSTGQSSVVYDAPTPFESYAQSLGLQPGSDEWNTALQDYVLRSSGPTATENDLALEGARFDNRATLEGIRHGNRVRLRQTPTYRQTHPAPRAPRRNGGGGRSVPTAINPTTGQRLELRGNRWVPAG